MFQVKSIWFLEQNEHKFAAMFWNELADVHAVLICWMERKEMRNVFFQWVSESDSDCVN